MDFVSKNSDRWLLVLFWPSYIDRWFQRRGISLNDRSRHRIGETAEIGEQQQQQQQQQQQRNKRFLFVRLF